MYKVKTSQRDILVRINGLGTENLIDRRKEIENMKLLSRFDVGPKVYCTFVNGLVYEFKPGREVSLSEMEKHCEAIAIRLAKFHRIVKPQSQAQAASSSSSSVHHHCPKSSNILQMTRRWMKSSMKIIETCHNKRENSSTNHTKADEEDHGVADRATCALLDSMNVPRMNKELSHLIQLIKKYHCTIKFCHNDLQPLNIIYDENAQRIHFIDFEYCGYNYQCFDIGNHFAEYAGLEQMDFARYPSPDLQRRFIRAYLREVSSNRGQAQETLQSQHKPQEPSEEAVEGMRRESNFFALLSCIAWGAWAIPQYKSSNIEFDYLRYGKQKFDLYWQMRDQFLKEFIEWREAEKRREQSAARKEQHHPSVMTPRGYGWWSEDP